MINKYAEIQQRIILYNACKGILRTKQAGLLGDAVIVGSDYAGNKLNQGMHWLGDHAAYAPGNFVKRTGNLVGKGVTSVGNGISNVGHFAGDLAEKAISGTAHGIGDHAIGYGGGTLNTVGDAVGHGVGATIGFLGGTVPAAPVQGIGKGISYASDKAGDLVGKAFSAGVHGVGNVASEAVKGTGNIVGNTLNTFGGAIGAAGGAAGGGYLGYKGGDWLNKKLGLTGRAANVTKILGAGLGGTAGGVGGYYAGKVLI